MSNIFEGQESWLDAPDFGTDCFNAFVLELADDVTGSCMIPMNLPKRKFKTSLKEQRNGFIKTMNILLRKVS